MMKSFLFNLHATKLFIVTSATKGGGGYHHPLDLVFRSKYCNVWYIHWFIIVFSVKWCIWM